jgi:hypothetical protein
MNLRMMHNETPFEYPIIIKVISNFHSVVSQEQVSLFVDSSQAYLP